MTIHSTFLTAYDAWAESPEHCGGSLFDAMAKARQSLDDKLNQPTPGPWRWHPNLTIPDSILHTHVYLIVSDTPPDGPALVAQVPSAADAEAIVAAHNLTPAAKVQTTTDHHTAPLRATLATAIEAARRQAQAYQDEALLCPAEDHPYWTIYTTLCTLEQLLEQPDHLKPTCDPEDLPA